MADPKKIAMLATDMLPPPDRLKRRGAMEPDEGSPDEEQQDDAEGVTAMDDFQTASEKGDSKAMFAALRRAVDACGNYGE